MDPTIENSSPTATGLGKFGVTAGFWGGATLGSTLETEVLSTVCGFRSFRSGAARAEII